MKTFDFFFKFSHAFKCLCEKNVFFLDAVLQISQPILMILLSLDYVVTFYWSGWHMKESQLFQKESALFSQCLKNEFQSYKKQIWSALVFSTCTDTALISAENDEFCKTKLFRAHLLWDFNPDGYKQSKFFESSPKYDLILLLLRPEFSFGQ